MIKTIKEWLFQFSYTKYLVKLSNFKNSEIVLPLSDQLAIINLLKALGAKKCRLELYQNPKKESWDINMAELDITKTGNIEYKNPSTQLKFKLDLKKSEHATISLANSKTIVFELSDSVTKKLFYTKLIIRLPVTLNELIEESKKLAKEDRLNRI
ncbi:hypothetical protein ACP3VS_22900 [Lysinibacillus sp. VIII_CA]|uniref:hypothetical protein n=1 Tax=Lysinibacillus TaxID=400634 RepID=UPI0018CD1EF7|nr:hypothetical protein [Lysinibacillus sphaericus]MBG9692523.1 hypothetical protein [Lysinibacillus sphaericus]